MRKRSRSAGTYTPDGERRSKVRRTARFQGIVPAVAQQVVDLTHSDDDESVQPSQNVQQISIKPPSPAPPSINSEISQSQPTSDECSVCYDPISEQGIIDSCKHLFCFECIARWSKDSSVCPVCKQRFKSIERKQKGQTDVVPQVTPDSTEQTRRRRRHRPQSTRVAVPHRDFRLEDPMERIFILSPSLIFPSMFNLLNSRRIIMPQVQSAPIPPPSNNPNDPIIVSDGEDDEDNDNPFDQHGHQPQHVVFTFMTEHDDQDDFEDEDDDDDNNFHNSASDPASFSFPHVHHHTISGPMSFFHSILPLLQQNDTSRLSTVDDDSLVTDVDADSHEDDEHDTYSRLISDLGNDNSDDEGASVDNNQIHCFAHNFARLPLSNQTHHLQHHRHQRHIHTLNVAATRNGRDSSRSVSRNASTPQSLLAPQSPHRPFLSGDLITLLMSSHPTATRQVATTTTRSQPAPVPSITEMMNTEPQAYSFDQNLTQHAPSAAQQHFEQHFQQHHAHSRAHRRRN